MDGEQQFTAPVGAEQSGMSSVAVHKQKQFFIKHTDEYSGQLLEGQFTTKKLSIREISAVSVRRTQLNGGYYFSKENPGRGIDEDTDWTNQMLAHLEYCLIQKPLWFNLVEIDDVDLLLKVYRECALFENSAKSPQQRAAVNTGSSQTDSGRESEQPRAAGHIEEVGGGQVQPSLDP